jgi:ribulose 1,5-bisphosphate carboxylase large subunit-like protein
VAGIPGTQFEYSSKVTDSGLSAGSNLKSKFGQQRIDLILRMHRVFHSGVRRTIEFGVRVLPASLSLRLICGDSS